MLEHGDDGDKARILAKIRGSVVKLAQNQYASHVCEQAITNSEPQNRSLLIDEILTNTEDGHPIPIMMQDDFASELSSIQLLVLGETLNHYRLCFAAGIGNVGRTATGCPLSPSQIFFDVSPKVHVL